MNNKGQTAPEYILVILVILVVVTTIMPVAKRVVPRMISRIQGTGR